MEVRLTGGPKEKTGGVIKQDELTPETYLYYCRLYLIEHISNNVSSNINYGIVSKTIHRIDPILFKNLNLETNKILLLNQIYSFFMEENERISQEFLYEKISHIANYDPEINKG